MLKQAICLGLLCIAGHTYSANIIVTTTDDVVKADAACSLREAIEYVNQGMPEAGYNGCGGKESTNIIELSGKSEYKLNKHIVISKSLQIKTTYSTDISKTNILGKNNAIIKMMGKDRIFLIDSPPQTITAEDGTSTIIDDLIIVNLYELTLDGCHQGYCADQGGLIFNKEILNIQYGQLLNGQARQGGAIYNAGIYEKNKALSSVTLLNSLVKANKAEQGAVIYSEIPQFMISHSVIRDNEVTASGAALLDIRDAFDEETSKNFGSVLSRGVRNSTIFNNTGYVVKVFDGMLINNVTVLLNSMGIIVDAPYNQAYVANSIIAQNGSLDCQIVAGGDANHMTNNVYSVGCAGNHSKALGKINLIAGHTTEGQCDTSSDGILCPFNTYADSLLGYFRPRLLSSYQQWSDSILVNHGPKFATEDRLCEATDQRGKSRPVNSELCDIGAIELVVDSANAASIGRDLFYGETATLSIVDQLRDGELIAPEQCTALYGNNPTGQPWQAGCMKIVQTNTVSKGTTRMSQSGEVTYVPNGNWHGSDEFKILVITSTKRLGDSQNAYIEMTTRFTQSPKNDFQNNKVKTSGGSAGLVSLLVLLGMMGFRRFNK